MKSVNIKGFFLTLYPSLNSPFTKAGCGLVNSFHLDSMTYKKQLFPCSSKQNLLFLNYL